jgi:D-alanyl-D-alanine carboxypeptidase
MMAATLFDRAFAGVDKPSKSLADLADNTQAASETGPSDMQQLSCHKGGRAAAAYNAETERLIAPLLAGKTSATPGQLVLTTTGGLARAAPIATRIGMVPTPNFDPKPVYIGPSAGYGGLIAQARPPHSPLGTPQPSGSVAAYAPEMRDQALAAIPLSEDTAALPLKSKVKPKAKQRAAHAGRNLRRHRVAREEASHVREPIKPQQKSAKIVHSLTAKGDKTSTNKTAVKVHPKTAASRAANTKTEAKAKSRAGTAAGRGEKHAKR